MRVLKSVVMSLPVLKAKVAVYWQIKCSVVTCDASAKKFNNAVACTQGDSDKESSRSNHTHLGFLWALRPGTC